MNARIHNLLADHKSMWTADFERSLLRVDPLGEHTGRVDRAQVARLYDLNLSVPSSVSIYVENNKAPE